MHSVIEELLKVAASEPLPLEDVSSFWNLHGSKTVVERTDDELVLVPSGFHSLGLSSKFGVAASFAERISYWLVTARLRSHSSIWATAKRLSTDLGMHLDYNAWKQTESLAVLTDHWKKHDITPKSFAVIGDGAGFLGALFHRRYPNSHIYSIDLPQMLVFQAQTQVSAGHGNLISHLQDSSDAPTGVTFVLPKDIESISEEIDCAINIASMQEMNERSIDSYFRFLRSRSTPNSLFYCINREEKELPGGEIVKFSDYPWLGEDRIFIDGPCPYYTHYLGRTMPKGPWLLGVRIPFINYLDGKIIHRLVHLAN